MYMIIGPGVVFTKQLVFFAKQTVQLMGTETADLQDDPNILGMQELHTVCVADGKCHWARIFWVLTNHWMIIIYESIAWDMIWKSRCVSSVFSFDFFFDAWKGNVFIFPGVQDLLANYVAQMGEPSLKQETISVVGRAPQVIGFRMASSGYF